MSRKRFTCRNLKNNYAAMGKAMGRPYYAGIKARDVKAAIDAERRKAAAEAKRRVGAKK